MEESTAQRSEQHVSLWVDTMAPASLGDTSFREVEVDVAVLGAGIAGATTALLLDRTGLSVALVDASRVGGQVTTPSTVKMTVGQGSTYSEITDELGPEAARTYAEANAAGLQRVVDLAEGLGIDCDLERGPHYGHAEQEEQVERVRRDGELAHAFGLPAVPVTDVPALPFPVAAAVRFDDQLRFHPGKYVTGLVTALDRARSSVFEGVRALDVTDDGEGGRCRVRTSAGTLTAGYVVVATHFPFLNRGGQFTRMVPMRE